MRSFICCLHGCLRSGEWAVHLTSDDSGWVALWPILPIPYPSVLVIAYSDLHICRLWAIYVITFVIVVILLFRYCIALYCIYSILQCRNCVIICLFIEDCPSPSFNPLEWFYCLSGS